MVLSGNEHPQLRDAQLLLSLTHVILHSSCLCIFDIAPLGPRRAKLAASDSIRAQAAEAAHERQQVLSDSDDDPDESDLDVAVCAGTTIFHALGWRAGT